MNVNLEKRITKIEERNQKVELDKKWETSFTRKIIIIIFTYFTIAVFMSTIKVQQPWINAVVPAIGFFISTLALPFVKNVWIKKQK